MAIFLSKIALQVDPTSLDKMSKDIDKALSGKNEVKIKAQLDLAKAESQLAKFNTEMKKVSAVADPAGWEKIRVKVLDATEQVNKHKRALDSVTKEMDNVGTKTSVWQKLGSAIGGALAIGTIVNWGKKIFDAASQVQQLQISYATMLGSVEKGNKLFAELQNFAKVTPFNATDIQKSARLMLAFGVDAQSVIPTMQALGEAVSAAGGNGETLNNAARAIGQIQTKGKLSAEEVNQLAENGIGVWKLLAEGMGKSEAQLIKMAADGKLLANDVLPILTAQMEKTFGGNMAKQAETLNGRLSNIQDTMTQTLAKLGTTVNPVFNAILTGMSWIVEKIGYMVTEFPRLSGVIISTIAALGLIGGAIVILGPIFAGLGAMITGLAVTMGVATATTGAFAATLAIATGPIGLLIGALALLGIGTAVVMDAMAEHDQVIIGYKDKLTSLEDQITANKKAYDDGSISTDEYRKKQEELQKQVEENKIALEKYAQGQKIVDDGNLNYIQRIDELNKLKLDPSAYEALIQENRKVQQELIKSINLQIALLDKNREIDAENSKSRGGANTGGGATAPLGQTGLTYIESLNRLTKEQQDANKMLLLGDEKVIKKQEEITAKINTTAGATGGAKKENEALKKSVDHLKDSYKILDNEISKVESARKKEVDAEKKWHATLQQSQQDTINSLQQVRDEYNKTVAKLNEDSTKQSINTTGDYYRSLLDAKKAEEKAQIDASGTTTLFDPAKLETIKKQIEEIQTTKNGDGSLSLSQNTRAKEDQRNSLSDQEKQRFDFMEKYGQIQLDLANNVSAATDKFTESRGQIEGMQNIVNAFENTKLRGSGLDSLAKSLKLQNTDKEAQALVDKLVTEKRNLITITDERISAESRVHTEALRLATEYHTAELGMVQARKTEYDDLIAKIRVAIDLANALRAAQASVGVSSSPSSSKKGFAEGGYTGNGGVNEVAGEVHGQEYVIPHGVLSHLQNNMPHIIPNLEAIRQGNRSSTSNIDQSRHVSITGPITVERPIDFENLLARAAWRNR